MKQLEDGNYEVEISFDITEQGHYFGVPRNYNLKKVQALIRSKINQEHIKKGYALCMYGHGARHIKQGYIASEVNFETKEVQEPIGKILSMSIRDKIITYTARIVKTAGNKADSVVDLITGGIGGFSFVWNVDKGFLYGADFVLQPNFNGNRVVMDSICTTGECALGDAMEDVVKDAIGSNEELFDTAYDLLSSQDDVYSALEFRDTMKAKLDAINSELEEHKGNMEKQKIKLSEKNKSIANLSSEKAKAETKARTLKTSSQEKEKEIATLKKKLEETEAKHKTTLDSIGMQGLIIEDNSVKVSTDVFGKLFQEESVLFDDVDISKLHTPKQPSDSIDVPFKVWYD